MTASALALLAIAVVAAGCGRAATGAGGHGFPAGTVLSFDLFLGDKLDYIDYALRELEHDCMAKAGYPQLRAAGNEVRPGSSQMLALSAQRVRGFASEQDARQRGFGTGFAAEPARVVSFDANFDQRWAQCRTESARRLDLAAKDLIATYNDLGNTLSTEFAQWSRDRIRHDMPTMLDCLSTRGFPAADREAFIKTWDVKFLNIAPGTMTSVGLDWEPTRVPGTVQVGPPVPERRYVPSARESDLAAAWYGCDQQSGRVDRYLADARTEAARLISRYEDRLADLNPKITELAKKAILLVGTP